MPTGTNTLHDARLLLAAIDQKHGAFMDSLIAPFTATVTDIVAQTLANISAALADLVVGPDGRIERTGANLNHLQTLDQRFATLMKKNGYNAAVRAFVAEFPGQLPFLYDALDIISAALKGPALTESASLTKSDMKVLVEDQKITVASLQEVVTTVAVQAKRKALFSVSGVSRQGMAELLAKQFGRTVGESRTLGATSMAMFFRIANERAIDKIDGAPALRYVYDGPDDALTRPFCHRLKSEMARGRTWSRSDIDALDNGQIPDSFLSGGGYNCRHQWRFALPEDSLRS